MSTRRQEASLQLALTTASIKAILAGRTDQTLILERLKRPAGGALGGAALALASDRWATQWSNI